MAMEKKLYPSNARVKHYHKVFVTKYANKKGIKEAEVYRIALDQFISNQGK